MASRVLRLVLATMIGVAANRGRVRRRRRVRDGALGASVVYTYRVTLTKLG